MTEQDSALTHLTSEPTPEAKARPAPTWRTMAWLIQKQQTQLQPEAKIPPQETVMNTYADKFKAF